MWFFVEYHDGRSEIIEANDFTEPPGWSHISAPASSKEELIEYNVIQPNPCKECGRIFGAHFTTHVREKLIRLGMCHTCNFWTEYVEKKDNPRAVRIDHRHYWAEDKVDKSTYQGMLGYGGSLFRIKFHDGRFVETNNLWHQGTIPPHFWERLPDNAEFDSGRYEISL